MAKTAPPAAIGSEKTRKSTSRTASVSSVSSMPKRTSGLSDPYRSMASAKVRRRNGSWRSALCGQHLLRDARHDPLDRDDHVLLGHEAHLDVDLRELRPAVLARVLVAHAVRDLVVAVVAGDHEQLLELLRRLRQRVEPPGLHARRHDEVARPLRRAADEERRLDLDEVLVLERRAGCCSPAVRA